MKISYFKKLLENIEKEQIQFKLQDADTPGSEIESIYNKNHKNPDIRLSVAKHPQIPAHVIDNILDFYSDENHARAIALNPQSTVEQITKAAGHLPHGQAHIIFENPSLYLQLLENPNALHERGDMNGLWKIASSPLTTEMQGTLYKNIKSYPDTGDKIQNKMRDRISEINRVLAANDSTHPEILKDIHDELPYYPKDIGNYLATNANLPKEIAHSLYQKHVKNGNIDQILSHPHIDSEKIKKIIPLLTKAKQSVKENSFASLASNPNLDADDIQFIEEKASKFKGKTTRAIALDHLATHPNRKK